MTSSILEWQDSPEKLVIRQLMEAYHADIVRFHENGYDRGKARAMALDKMIYKVNVEFACMGLNIQWTDNPLNRNRESLDLKDTPSPNRPP